MKINVTIDISREILESVFITAIEGGSNYWYYINKKAVDIVVDAVTNNDGKAFSEMVFEAVFDHGRVIPVGDVEDMDGDNIGYLDRDTFQERLQKCADDSGWAIRNETEDCGDAGSSDVIFQYLALGELVYG